MPAWWAVTRSARVRLKPMRYGYGVGLIYFGACFWWISEVTTIGTIWLVSYLALYPALWFLFVARLLPGRDLVTPIGTLVNAVGAASLWVTLEWLRSWCLTGFNWDELGISQAPSIVYRQLAAYGGVHLISFVLVAVSVLWAEGVLGMAATLRQRRVLRVSFGFGAALLVVALGFAVGEGRVMWGYMHRSTIVSFACVQPNVPQIPGHGASYELAQQAALDKLQRLTLTAIGTQPPPRLLIWPEAIVDEGVFNDRPMNDAVHDICRAYSGSFLLGSQDFQITTKTDLHPASARLYNAAYLFSDHGDTFDEYRKTHLVLLGEFLPFGDTFPWLRRAVGIGMDFSPGPGPRVFTLKDPPVRFAPLICFEDSLPEVADAAMAQHPDFFVTITNDGWYTGVRATWDLHQHLNHAVFRCIEHDRPMIRCCNNGISCLIDGNGTVVSQFADERGKVTDVEGVFCGNLKLPCDDDGNPAPPFPTFYEHWGDWIVLISQVVVVMLGLWLLRRAR